MEQGNMLNDSQVAVFRQTDMSYPKIAPFHPPKGYPEFTFERHFDPQNSVYDSIRNLFKYLKMDRQNYGSPYWNPLNSIVNQGDMVLIKPNMIAHSHRYTDAWVQVITHGSVLRAVIDYVYLALKGEGRIIIADAPQTDSKIDFIKERMGIDDIQEYFWKEKKFEVEFIDLRNECWIENNGIYLETIKLPGDPMGNIRVNLGKHSFLSEHDGRGKIYYGAFYDKDETNKHHTNGIHEYLISRTALECDAFISLPKLKTHKKVGVTINLKGLVGINGDKNWLPHYALGGPEVGGDQYPSRGFSQKLENAIVLKAKKLLLSKNPLVQKLAVKLKGVGYSIFGDTEKVIRSGNWHGNDTCWRMTLDLNRILLYGNTSGKLNNLPKKYFSIVDGIIGMEGNGPVAGEPVAAGLVIAGINPLAVDLVCTKLIGFDYRKIPMLYNALNAQSFKFSNFQPDDIMVSTNIPDIEGNIFKKNSRLNLKFQPHFGWRGHI
jgi:uncharacterized protein (DUF362 family)